MGLFLRVQGWLDVFEGVGVVVVVDAVVFVFCSEGVEAVFVGCEFACGFDVAVSCVCSADFEEFRVHVFVGGFEAASDAGGVSVGDCVDEPFVAGADFEDFVDGDSSFVDGFYEVLGDEEAGVVCEVEEGSCFVAGAVGVVGVAVGGCDAFDDSCAVVCVDGGDGEVS